VDIEVPRYTHKIIGCSFSGQGECIALLRGAFRAEAPLGFGDL